jgi:PKD repeat protein
MWAKIVNDEIMQLSDENPAGLWHPDAIEKNDIPGYWDEVPDHVSIGWHFRDNEWISGGQWFEECEAAREPTPPGPPTANWRQDIEDALASATVNFHADPAGIWDSYSWVIDGKEYGQEETVTVEFTKTSTTKTIPVEFIVTGPGGTVTSTKTSVELKPLVVAV